MVFGGLLANEMQVWSTQTNDKTWNLEHESCDHGQFIPFDLDSFLQLKSVT